MDIHELETEIIFYLYNFHNTNRFSTPANEEMLIKSLSNKYGEGAITLAITKLEKQKKITRLKIYKEPIFASSLPVYYLAFGGRKLVNIEISLSMEEYEDMLHKNNMVKKSEQDTFGEFIEIPEHQEILQSITEITEAVLQNNEVSEEARNIANNLQMSNDVISEKKGEVKKSFIEYIINCLKTLYQGIVIINMLTDVAKQIAMIIETLQDLL